MSGGNDNPFGDMGGDEFGFKFGSGGSNESEDAKVDKVIALLGGEDKYNEWKKKASMVANTIVPLTKLSYEQDKQLIQSGTETEKNEAWARMEDLVRVLATDHSARLCHLLLLNDIIIAQGILEDGYVSGATSGSASTPHINYNGENAERRPESYLSNAFPADANKVNWMLCVDDTSAFERGDKITVGKGKPLTVRGIHGDLLAVAVDDSNIEFEAGSVVTRVSTEI